MIVRERFFYEDLCHMCCGINSETVGNREPFPFGLRQKIGRVHSLRFSVSRTNMEQMNTLLKTNPEAACFPLKEKYVDTKDRPGDFRVVFFRGSGVQRNEE